MAKLVQAFQSRDGSIHSTQESADHRDKWDADRELESRLFPIIERYLGQHHFSALTDSIAPYDGFKWHKFQYERDQFCKELAEMIIQEMDEMTKLIKGELM